MTSDFITVVSGVPRSGTSMMMQMLEAGGMSILTDSLRTANADNPLGYYEYEPVKGLSKGQSDWLPLAQEGRQGHLRPGGVLARRLQLPPGLYAPQHG